MDLLWIINGDILNLLYLTLTKIRIDLQRLPVLELSILTFFSQLGN